MRCLLLLSLSALLCTGPSSFAQDPARERGNQGRAQGETKPRQEQRQDRGQEARPRENGRPAAQQQPQQQRVGFRWGPGGRVTVRETETVRSADGERALVSTYDMRWVVEESGVSVTRQPRAFQMLGDEPAPADAKPLRARRVHDLLTPPLAIDEAGAFRGFAVPIEVETLASKLDGEGEGELATELRRAHAEPAAQIRARQEARDAWEAWFGAWQGAPIRVGEPIETERPVYTGFGGATAQAQVRLACAETLEHGGETCARLELKTSHAGPELAEAIRSASALAKDPGMERLAASIQGRSVDMEGLIGVATGRPHRVAVTVTTTFDDGDGGTRTLVDAREYEFDWAKAQLMPGAATGRGAKDAGKDAGKPGGKAAQPGPKGKQPGQQGQQQGQQQGKQGKGGAIPPQKQKQKPSKRGG